MIQILKKNQKGHSLAKYLIFGRFIFLKRSVIGKKFVIPVCFIILNRDFNQFEFSYLTKLLSTFKVRPSLDAFHTQLSDKEVKSGVKYSSVLKFFIEKPSFRFRF